jgi:hypothetical protein
MSQKILLDSCVRGVLLTINPLSKNIDFKISGLTIFEGMGILNQAQQIMLELLINELKGENKNTDAKNKN